MDLWPMVVHLPKEEQRRFFWKISLRYIKQTIFYTPLALWHAWRHPGLSKLSDEDFCDYLCVRSYSKFIYEASKEEIEKYLPSFEMDRLKEGKRYFISDLYLMRHIPSQDGQYVATTVCLFEEQHNKMHHFKPMGIYVVSCPEKGKDDQKTKALIYPEDGNAWALAKYYAAMGCAYRIVFSMHSTLHFPMDAVNAITKSILPKSNRILQVLLPHLEFSLELDLVVQTSKTSPIKNHQEFPFTGVTGTAAEIAGLFVDAHQGVEERGKAYPPFHFKMKPQSESNSEYYLFQVEYYNCIERFVKKFLHHLSDKDREELKPWAKYIAPFINMHINESEFEHLKNDKHSHFPDETEVLEAHEGVPILETLISTLIWDLTVGHAADHYDFGMMDFDHMPMRMRIPPPASRNVPDFKQKDLRSFIDVYKHRLEWKMFYMPTNVNELYDVNYNFDTPDLQQLNKEFLEDLRQTEKGLAEKGIRNFMPLKIIARSIQY
jgi:hypothetical protein